MFVLSKYRYFSKIKSNIVLGHSKRNINSTSPAFAVTSLYDFHLKNGGKMINFAGYEMPVQYGKIGISESHKHVRKNCGLFDVSHMLQVNIHGKDKEDFVERISVADIKNLPDNSGTLSLFTNDNGGIIDDLICSKVKTSTCDHLYIVSNAGCKEKDLKNMRDHLEKFKKANGDATIEVLEDQGLVALQGPKSASVLQKLTSCDLSNLYFMNTVVTELGGIACRVSRCGYTGEDGFEISVPNSQIENLCTMLTEDSSVQLTGLGARDSLRLEAGLCLYGNDIDESTTPIQATLAWTISKRRRANADFPGAQIILDELKAKPLKKRIGLVSAGPPPRSHCKVFDMKDNSVGEITSGVPSPSLACNVSMAYVPLSKSKLGTKLQVQVRNKKVSATVTKMPFIKSNYYHKQ